MCLSPHLPEAGHGSEVKKQRYFQAKNGPGHAQPRPSAEFWEHQATASREKVRFEVRCARSKPETPKQAPNMQERREARDSGAATAARPACS